MLRVGVLVSGGGTNLQAILDAVKDGTIRNAEVVYVQSNNPGVYALTRAEKAGVEAEVLSPKSFETRAEYNTALVKKLKEHDLDLIVLAGFLVQIPAEMIRAYRGRIINIHPSLIPSFCGKGLYGLKPHEAALKRGVLQRRVMEQAEWILLPKAIDGIANGTIPYGEAAYEKGAES